MFRRRFLQAGAAFAGPALWPLAAAGQGRSLGPATLGVAELQAALHAGDFSSAELVQALTARADTIDSAGPRLNALIERNAQALAIAHALDHERRRQGPRGPLHGIPVLLKDNIDTGDDMLTSAGSLALAGRPAPQDAFVAQRLRAAGCVVLGKTNLSEWANFRGTGSTSGWSARGGQTLNPHALDRSPSGSSSGSAVAVAAGLAPLAVGTETDGSITSPAAVCGVVGFKPTVGLVSRRGIVPISHTQDTAGPMARSVADAAALLGAMGGVDARDPATHAGRARALPDYTRFLVRGGLKGARIGVAREFFGRHDGVDRLIGDALAALRAEGAVLGDPVPVVGDAAALGAAEFEVLLYEFKAGLNAYLAQRGATSPVQTLAELIAWNEAHGERELRWFGQQHFIAAQRKGPLTDAAYRQALARCRRMARAEGIDAALARYRLDAIVAPTTGPAYPIDLVNGDHFGGACSQPAAVAGYPHITVPAGFVHGLPVGLSFFAGAWSEPMLLRLAYAYEQATQMRRAPAFAARVALP